MEARGVGASQGSRGCCLPPGGPVHAGGPRSGPGRAPRPELNEVAQKPTALASVNCSGFADIVARLPGGGICPHGPRAHYALAGGRRQDGSFRTAAAKHYRPGYAFLIAEVVAARIDELGLFEAQGADLDDCMRPFRSVVDWYNPESWTSMCHDCSGSGRARRLAVGGRRTMRCDWRAPRHGAPAAPPVSASPGEAGLAPSLHAAPAACGVASAAAAARDAPLRGRFRFGRSPARDPAAVERNWFRGCTSACG